MCQFRAAAGRSKLVPDWGNGERRFAATIHSGFFSADADRANGQNQLADARVTKLRIFHDGSAQYVQHHDHHHDRQR